MTSEADARKSLQDSFEQKTETAREARKRNPVGVVERRFNDTKWHRVGFIEEAKEMAELVMPGMYEDDSVTTVYGDFITANQSLISKGVLLLSWSMASVILPSDGDYFSRMVEPSVAAYYEQLENSRQAASDALGPNGDPKDFTPITQQINNSLLREDLVVKRRITVSNHQEVLARCLYHSLISGISVFGHLTLDEAKAYTIQNSAVVFDSALDPVEVIVRDRMPLVALPETVRKFLVSNAAVEELPATEQFVTIYTQQIRTGPDTVRVNTEISGLHIDEMSFDLPSDAPALIPIPFMFLNTTDPFPIGWLTYNRGDCNAYENLSLSIEGMVATAAKTILGLPPGAKVTEADLRESVGLSVLPKPGEAKLDLITAPIAQNLQQVLGWHDKKERQLMMTFGMDFAVQRPGERVTAEEIQTLSVGLQKLFGSTYKQLERGFQHRHCRRQFYLAEEDKLVSKLDKNLYTLSLTAGLQTAEANNDVQKMDQLIMRAGQVAQLSGMPVRNINRDTMLQWYAQKMRLDVSDKLLTSEQEAEQLGISQLIEVVRSIGPSAPGMVAQMLMQLMGGMTGESQHASGASGLPTSNGTAQ